MSFNKEQGELTHSDSSGGEGPAGDDTDDDSDSSDTDTSVDSEKSVSEVSSIDVPEDKDVRIAYAPATRGVWGLAHVWDGKLYFTRDVMDDAFLPKGVAPPVPKAATVAKASAPKTGVDGKVKQEFVVVWNRKTGFSTVPKEG